MNLSLAVRIGQSAGGLHEKIGFAGDGIVVSGEGLELGDVGVVEVGAEGEIAVAGEMAVLESGGGVEFGGSVVTAQRGVAQSDARGRKAGARRKENPIAFGAASVGGGGKGDVEILDLQITGKLRRRRRNRSCCR